MRIRQQEFYQYREICQLQRKIINSILGLYANRTYTNSTIGRSLKNIFKLWSLSNIELRAFEFQILSDLIDTISLKNQQAEFAKALIERALNGEELWCQITMNQKLVLTNQGIIKIHSSEHIPKFFF